MAGAEAPKPVSMVTSAAQDPSHTVDSAKTIAIIGGSISGIHLAAKAKAKGIPFVIFEQSDNIGGVWTRFANDTSQLQGDSVGYLPIDNTTDYPVYASTAEFIKVYQEFAENNDILRNIRFSTRVVKVVPVRADDTGPSCCLCCSGSGGLFKGVQLQLEDGSMTDVFHSVHIRTGSLSRLNRRTLVGEELFRGSLITGTSNDANPSGQKSVYQKNSSVVIVGFGSFAAENVRSAVEGGAKSITIVCRRVKTPWVRAMGYLAAIHNTRLKNAFVPSDLDSVWDDFMSSQEDFFAACNGARELFQHSVIDYEGRKHFSMQSGANSDVLYAALHYGVLKIVVGEVTSLASGAVNVLTKDGTHLEIPADVVAQCLGFTCDTRLLDGIPLVNGFFGYDGRLTHNINLDHFERDLMLGPRARVPLPPLISYGILSDVVDALTLQAVLDMNVYRAFANRSINEMYRETLFAQEMDYKQGVLIMYRIFTSGLSPVVRELMAQFYSRHESYLKKLNIDTFHAFCKKEWDEQVKALSEGTGKPRIEYPWQPPKPLPKQSASLACYQSIYTVASWTTGVRFALELSKLGCMQGILRAIM